MAELGFSKTQGKKGDGSRAATPAQVIQLVMQEAQRRGLSWFKPHHAAGMVGSFIQESGNFRNDVINFQVRGDNGTAHGLMQWRGKRFQNLLTYAKQSGSPAQNIRTQVSFAFEEAMPNSRFKDFGSVKAFKIFPQTQNVQQAATAFVHAERPAGYDGNPNNAHDVGKRAKHAMSAFNSYDGASPELRQGTAIPGQADGGFGQGAISNGTAPFGVQGDYVPSSFQSRSGSSQVSSMENFGAGGNAGLDAGSPLSQQTNNFLDPLGIIKFAEKDSLNPFTKQLREQRKFDAFGA